MSDYYFGPRTQFCYLGESTYQELADASFSIPQDKEQYLRDRSFDVSHIKIQCSFDITSKCVIGKTTLSITALTDNVRYISLDCADTVVSKVSLEDEYLEFELSDDTLNIWLPEALTINKLVNVTVEYNSTPQKGIYFITPDEDYPNKPTQIWTQGQDTDNHHWFPCIDEPNGRLTSEIVCTVPKGWRVISNGQLIDTTYNEDSMTFHWYQDKPHAVYLITLVAGEFSRVMLREDSPSIDFYCEPGREEDAARAFENTVPIIKFFEETTGEPYPWAKYSQVAVQDFIFGGMENTSATTQTDLTLHDAKAHKDFSSDFLVAHEAAHQWFGDLITCKEWAHGWLNEGFATFFEALWQEYLHGSNEYLNELITMQRSYLSEKYRRPIVCRRYTNHTDIFDRHLYEKAGFILHILRQELGDKDFFNSIKHYVSQNKGRNVVTIDLQRAIEEITHRNMEWFFEQWLYCEGHVDINISYTWEDNKEQDGSVSGGWAHFSIKQKQERLFRFSSHIWIHDGEKANIYPVKVTEQQQNISFKFVKKPKAVMFDPLLSVLKTVEFKRPREMLIFQIQNGCNAAICIEAANNLEKESSQDVIDSLSSTMFNHSFWGVQAAAAIALGNIRTSYAKDALISASSLTNLKARRAVAAALGKFRYHKDTADTLAKMILNNESYYVSAAAAVALGNTQVEGVFNVLCDTLENTESHIDVIRCGALLGLGNVRDKAARDIVLEWTKRGKPQRTRVAAISALAKLSQEDKFTVEHIISLLYDSWFQVKIAATSALAQLNAQEAIPELMLLSQRDKDARVARLAHYAIRSIQKGSSVSQNIRSLSDRVDKLQAENLLLKEQLNKLSSKLEDILS